MFIDAVYDGKPCKINTDYIMDVFQKDKIFYKAYTIDFDRGCYLIKKKVFEDAIKESEDGK